MDAFTQKCISDLRADADEDALLSSMNVDKAGLCVCFALTSGEIFSDDEILSLAGKPLDKASELKFEVARNFCVVLLMDAARKL